MVYPKQNLNLNNMERQAGATVFKLTPVIKKADRSNAPTYLAIGDILVLGKLASDATTLDMRLLLHEGFPVGTTFNFGFAIYEGESDVVVGITPFASAVKVDRDFITVVLPMPTSGIVNPDDSPYIGDKGSIWGGVEIVAELASGVMDGTGNVDMINSHSYYGTKSTGAYVS